MQVEGIDSERYILHFESSKEDFFYDSKSAHSAADTLTNAISKLTEINPIFIYGPSGCGKTHLIRGFAEDFHARYPDKVIELLSTRGFMDELLFAIKTETEWFFEEKHNNVDLVVLDNLGDIIGRPLAERKLKDFLERSILRGMMVICVSSLPPLHYSELHQLFGVKFPNSCVAEMTHTGQDSRRDYIKHYSKALGIFIPEAESEALSSARSTIYSIKAEINKRSLEWKKM